MPIFRKSRGVCCGGEKVPFCYNKRMRLARAQCKVELHRSQARIAAIGRGSRNEPQTAGAEAYSMITREQIRKLAGYSYSRGVDIWRQGKIRRFQIKTTKKGRQIQADVKGSGRNLYNVRILLDEEEDSVQEAWCDCPAFYSYEGLCKHCTAVLLYYLENPTGGRRAYEPAGVLETAWAGRLPERNR